MNDLTHNLTERWLEIEANRQAAGEYGSDAIGYDIRRCVDCDHFRLTFGSTIKGEQRRVSQECAYAIDPVTGTITTRLAHTERQVGYCGYEARHFRRK